MRSLLLLTGLLLTPLAPAQVRLAVSLPHQQFLVYENIPLRLHLDNQTGAPLLIDGSNGVARLFIDVRDLDNHPVEFTDEVPLADTWYVPTQGRDAQEFDLLRLRKIRKAGSFSVRVSVTVREGEVYQSDVIYFQVVNGTTYGKLVRARSDREYTLLGINRSKEDQLVLRVTNRKGTLCMGSYYLERHLRLYPPLMETDSQGNVHILQYRDPTTLVHCRFNAEGEPLGRDYYKYPPGPRASLVPGEGGTLRPSGGAQLVMDEP